MPSPGCLESKAEHIVEDLLGASVPKERGALAFDYAVGIDDVELVNETEDAEKGKRGADEGILCILEHVKVAVDAVLQRWLERHQNLVLPKGKQKHVPLLATDQDRRRFLRERCSFHLLRPMAEALFFGEREALERAAGPGVSLPPVHFDPSQRDIEDFTVDDPSYLAMPSGKTRWARENRRRHPKHYLEYLLDPEGTVPRPYKEKVHGRRALDGLCWQAVLAHPSHARLTRALLADISQMVGTRMPSGMLGSVPPETSPKARGRLRNLS